MKRPAFQFYPGNWQSDIALRACSVGARGCWIEMMCLMHQAEPYGHLLLNGKAIGPDQLAGMIGGRATAKDVRGWLAELESNGVFSRNGDGSIFSRRMVRDEATREARSEGGKAGSEHGSKGAEHGRKGGRPRKQTGVEKPPSENTTGVEKPPLKPPPSSASASASADASISIAADPPPLRATPPMPPAAGSETDRGQQATRLGQVARRLREAGIRCGPNTAGVAELAADPRVTDELLAEALTQLAERPAGSYGPQVVLLRVQDLLTPPKRRSAGPAAEFPAWRTDDQQCDRLGKALGLWPNTGEEYPQYRQRIAAKLTELREREAA